MNDTGLGILLVALASVYAAFAAWRHGNDKRDVVALAVSAAAIGATSGIAFAA